MEYFFKYKYATKLFTEYLLSKKYPAKEILLRDIMSNIGIILEFLSSQNIYCLVDCYNLIVYTDKEYYVKRYNTIYIIKETENEKRMDIIHNYVLAIDKAFYFLDNPF